MRANPDSNPLKQTYRILHLRKEFERNLPIFINVVKGIDNSRFTHIICYLGENRGGKNTLTEQGYEVIYLGFKKRHLDRFNPLVLAKLSRILRGKNIDLLHCHKHKPAVYGVLASLVSGRIPVIEHVHGLSRTRSINRRLANLVIYRFINKVIAVSDSVRQDIIQSNWRVDPSKIITVKNCIDLTTIDAISISKNEARSRIGLAEDEIVFGTVGRLASTKGQSFLIEAFSKVRTQLKHSRLVIIGSGPLLGELEKLAKNLGVYPRVLFTGYRNDIFEILKGFDIFVLPSLAEGLSIALLEAMASRLPVIASRVGGIPEVFGNSDCGKLVPSKNIHALASAMIDIASLDDYSKKALGKHGRHRIEDEFTTDIMIKKLTGIYESVLTKTAS